MKIRAVHLLSNPTTDPREIRSISEISQLKNHGFDYIQIVNPPWSEEIPETSRQCNLRPFKLTKGHYGCYKAHKDAILQYLTDDIDGLLMFECDAILTVPFDEFLRRINRASTICKDFDLLTFTFGPKHGGKTIHRIEHDVITITQFIETHAYYIPIKSKEIFIDMFNKPWDALDYCYTIYFYDQMQYKIGTFNDRPISAQATGKSLIDNWVKTSEEHFKHLQYNKDE